VAFSPDGKRIASGSLDSTVKVWDSSTGQELLSLMGHTKGISSVAFSPDGKRIASGSLDSTVKVWDSSTGRELLLLKGYTNGVSSVAFSPDGKLVLTGNGDRTAKVWDAEMGQEVLSLKGHTKEVRSVAFSPDGKRIASGSWDNTVKVWDSSTGQELLSLIGHTKGISSVAFSPDGKRIASGSLDSTVKVWDSSTGQELLSLKGHTNGVNVVVFSPDGKRLASGGKKKFGVMKVWDSSTGRELLSHGEYTAEVTSVAFSSDGKRIASGSGDNTFKVLDSSTGQELLSLKDTKGSSSVAFSPDGKRIASGSEDSTVKVWDSSTGQELLSLKGHTNGVKSVVFSPDGKRIASGSLDSTVKVWDVERGQEVLSLKGHLGGVTSLAFSSDGNRLAGGNSNTVLVWVAEGGQEVIPLKGHTGSVQSVAFSPDGKRILGKIEWRTLAWDVSTGQLLPEATAVMPSGGREATSPNGWLQVFLTPNDIYLERSDPEIWKQSEARARELLARRTAFDPDWHRKQIRSGDDFAAAFHLARLVREQFWDSSLHIEAAHVLARLGRRQESATHLMHALFLNPHVSLWPDDPTVAQRGDQAAQAGDWNRAVQALQGAAHQPRASASSLTNLLLAQAAAGDKTGTRQTGAAIVRWLATERDVNVQSTLLAHAESISWEDSWVAPLLDHARQALASRRDATNLHRYGAALYRAGQFAEAEQKLAESVKVHSKGGYVNTWLFQAMTARQLGKHDEATRMLDRFEDWHLGQKFPNWQTRVRLGVLLAEARVVVRNPPPMPKLAADE
jgi:WD40 repeat protein